MASRDYEEFIAALNDHGARYLIVGAHAVAFHARPRATKDLDILPTCQGVGPVKQAIRSPPSEAGLKHLPLGIYI